MSILITPEQLCNWLANDLTVASTIAYRHRHMLERDSGQLSTLKPGLKAYVNAAHEDAKRQFDLLFGSDLDPLNPDPASCSVRYPSSLPRKTLMGCFGEVMAGLFTELLMPFDTDGWHIPAYLFRVHENAEQYLTQLKFILDEGGNPDEGGLNENFFGRDGSDCLAFKKNAENKIIAVIVCEAKCLATNNDETVAKAYGQVCKGTKKPVSLNQVIRIVRDKTDAQSMEWNIALTRLFNTDDLNDYQRHNLIAYFCGTRPNASTGSYLPKNTPHTNYVGEAPLEVIEVSIRGLKDLVREIYDVMDEW